MDGRGVPKNEHVPAPNGIPRKISTERIVAAHVSAEASPTFSCLVAELDPAGKLYSTTTFHFEEARRDGDAAAAAVFSIAEGSQLKEKEMKLGSPVVLTVGGALQPAELSATRLVVAL